MECPFKPSAITTMFVISGGFILTAAAIVCLLFNRVSGCLRGIMLSYLTSNIVACIIFLYQLAMNPCNGHVTADVINMSIVSSLSHILLLILHYYIILTSNAKPNFIALIPTAWITSATSGTISSSNAMSSVNEEVTKSFVVVVVVCVVGLYIAVRVYFFILKTHRRKKTFLLAYKENFLHFECENEDTNEEVKGQWNLEILGIILFIYVLCSVPWLTLELIALHCPISDTFAVVITLVYSLHFYIPTSVNIYMRWRELQTRRRDDLEVGGGNKGENLRENYSFRRLSRAYSYNSSGINTSSDC